MQRRLDEESGRARQAIHCINQTKLLIPVQQTVTYHENNHKMDIDDPSPTKLHKKKPNESASDVDYRSAPESDIDDDSDDLTDPSELKNQGRKGTVKKPKPLPKGRSAPVPVPVISLRSGDGTITLLHPAPINNAQVSGHKLPAKKMVRSNATNQDSASKMKATNQLVADETSSAFERKAASHSIQ